MSRNELNDLLNLCLTNSKSHFENMFTCMTKSIFIENNKDWNEFIKLKDNEDL